MGVFPWFRVQFSVCCPGLHNLAIKEIASPKIYMISCRFYPANRVLCIIIAQASITILHGSGQVTASLEKLSISSRYDPAHVYSFVVVAGLLKLALVGYGFSRNICNQLQILPSSRLLFSLLSQAFSSWLWWSNGYSRNTCDELQRLASSRLLFSLCPRPSQHGSGRVTASPRIDTTSSRWSDRLHRRASSTPIPQTTAIVIVITRDSRWARLRLRPCVRGWDRDSSLCVGWRGCKPPIRRGLSQTQRHTGRGQSATRPRKGLGKEEERKLEGVG